MSSETLCRCGAAVISFFARDEKEEERTEQPHKGMIVV